MAQVLAIEPSNSYPLTAQGWGTKSGPNTWFSRWVEDWSQLKQKPRDQLTGIEKLKYMPLSDSGDVYLTLSGEARLRADYYDNPGLRDVAAQRIGMFRGLLGADLHVGDHFRFYTQINHGTYDGKNIASRPASQDNDLILLQAFGDVTGQFDDIDVGLRVGRQDFSDGPLQVVSTRENPNIQFALNGVRAWAIAPNYRLDLFEFRYSAEDRGFFDDDIDTGKRFRGVVTGFRLPGAASGLFLEPFWYSARDDNRRWGNTIGREVRDYFGLRLAGTRGRWTQESSVMYQTGDYMGRGISAYSAHTQMSWGLGTEETAPRLGFHADLGSGGGAYSDTARLRGASYLFGNTPFFSYGMYLSATNLAVFAPTYTFSVTPDVKIALEWELLRRRREDDAIYNGVGAAYAGTQLVDGKDVGDLLRVNATWSLNPYLSLTGRAEYMRVGQVFEDAGYRDGVFVGTWLTARF